MERGPLGMMEDFGSETSPEKGPKGGPNTRFMLMSQPLPVLKKSYKDAHIRPAGLGVVLLLPEGWRHDRPSGPLVRG